MVELAQWQTRFEALGVRVAAMSYDTEAVLAAFHAEHDLGYPLLRDEDVRHVKAYGILNPQYQPGHEAYGIPLPGVLFVAPDGRIVDKFAVPDYRERPDYGDVYRAVSERLAAPPADAAGGRPAAPADG